MWVPQSLIAFMPINEIDIVQNTIESPPFNDYEFSRIEDFAVSRDGRIMTILDQRAPDSQLVHVMRRTPSGSYALAHRINESRERAGAWSIGIDKMADIIATGWGNDSPEDGWESPTVFGSARIYQKVPLVDFWIPIQYLQPVADPGNTALVTESYGSDVEISDDGQWLAVGSPASSDSQDGAVYIYHHKPVSIIVNSLEDGIHDDPDVTTLREALIQAQLILNAAEVQHVSISFASQLNGESITLTDGPFEIPALTDFQLADEDQRIITIDASSLPDGLTLDGDHQSRIFSVGAGNTLYLRHLVLTRGRVSLPETSGGAMLFEGESLIIHRCRFIDNMVDLSVAIAHLADIEGQGGAISFNGASLSKRPESLLIYETEFFGNSVKVRLTYDGAPQTEYQTDISRRINASGGALQTGGIDQVAIINSSFYRNETAVNVEKLVDPTPHISFFTSIGARHGSILIPGTKKTSLINSTFSGNVTRLTVTDEAATNSMYISALGSAAPRVQGVLEINHVTIVDNLVVVELPDSLSNSYIDDTGVILVPVQGSSISNTVITGNSYLVPDQIGTDQIHSQDVDTPFGTDIQSSGHNFIGVASAELFSHPTDRLGGPDVILDPRLEPLQYNGGFTRGHMPAVGSPLIDGAGFSQVFSTDQRGFDRIASHAADIGAVEHGAPITSEYDSEPIIRFWSHHSVLVPESERNNFGISLDFDGSHLLVGANADEDGNGAAYLYHLDMSTSPEGAWNLTHRFNPVTDNPTFGSSVSMDGRFIAISGNNAEVFTRNENSPEQWNFEASIPGYFDGIKIHGDLLAVGNNPSNIAGGIESQFTLLQRSEPGNWLPILNDSDLVENKFQYPGIFHLIPEIQDSQGRITQRGQFTVLYDSSALQNEAGVLVFGRKSNDPETAVASFRSRLYYQNAPAGQESQAIFRFKSLLYKENEGSVVPDYGAVSAVHFTDMDRAALASILPEIENLAALYPERNDTADLLLDTYYDRATVHFILARESLIDIDLKRLDGYADEQVIDGEIQDYEMSLFGNQTSSRPGLRKSIQEYFQLFNASPSREFPVGVGFRAFIERNPLRNVEPSQYVLTGNTTLQFVPGEAGENPAAPLTEGYRDSILLFEMLGEYGNSASILADLYHRKGEKDKARSLLSSARQMLSVYGSLIRSICRIGDADPEALAGPVAQWEQSLSDLKDQQLFVEGPLNPLGFDPEFLLLFDQEQGQAGVFFDTFDIIKNRLQTSASSELANATSAESKAIIAYNEFVESQGEVRQQLVSIASSSRARIRELTQLDFGTDAYNRIPDPDAASQIQNGIQYDDAGFVVGSEFSNQYLNIQIARNNIEDNRVAIENLRQRVFLEVHRNSYEVQKRNAMADVHIRYGDQTASLELEIGRINAAQQYADKFANALNPANWGAVIGNAVSAGVTVYAELRKGEIESQKQQLAALEKAEIISLENDVLNKNSQTKIATWMLEMNTIALDSQEAVLRLQQEAGKMQALWQEKQRLERRIAIHAETQTRRFYAHPIQRVRALNELREAQRDFRRAHEMVFYMARALEYKRNEQLVDITGVDQAMQKILAARNTRELNQWVDDLDSYNFLPGAATPTFDIATFSLRRDYFNYFTDDELGVESGAALYIDPLDSDERVDAMKAFRNELILLARRSSNPASYIVRLPFNTVNDYPPSGLAPNFFAGPIFDDGDGSIIDSGIFLEKIRSIAVTVQGDFPQSSNDRISTELEYGGTSFIRNPSSGDYSFTGPSADLVSGEWTTFPVRNFYTSGAQFFVNDSIRANINANLVPVGDNSPPASNTSDPDTPVFATLGLRERSVASTGWSIRLILPDTSVNRIQFENIHDILIHFDRQFLTRQE